MVETYWNPDVVVLPTGDLQLTITIDKINADHYQGVQIEGREATYEARRDALAQQERPDFRLLRECSRASFTVPLAQAKGWAIGSTVVITIARKDEP